MALCQVYTAGDMDAETALIKSILERHKYGYSVHDVAASEDEQKRMVRKCHGAKPPLVLVGKRVVWTAAEMPAHELSGELLHVLQQEHKARRARDEYRMGMLYLGQRPLPFKGSPAGEEPGGLAQRVAIAHARRDPFVALEWLRRSAAKGDAKGQCALATLLLSGEAGLRDEEEASRLLDEAAAQGSRSAMLALGSLRLERSQRAAPSVAAAELVAATAHFRKAAERGCAEAWVWLARTEAAQEGLRKGGRVRGRGERDRGGAEERADDGERGGSGGAGGASATRETSIGQRRLMERAAADGSAEGRFWWAHTLCGGRLPPAHGAALTAEARELLAKAASAGHAPSMYTLGCAALAEHKAAAVGGEARLAEALDLIFRAAHAGLPVAQAAVGHALVDPVGGPFAAPLTACAAAGADSQGTGESVRSLGARLAQLVAGGSTFTEVPSGGQPPRQILSAADEGTIAAAGCAGGSRGNAEAAGGKRTAGRPADKSRTLGLQRAASRERGAAGKGGAVGVSADEISGYTLLEAAAQRGEPAAMVGLGDCHFLGRAGVRQEPLLGLAWYCVAARKGSERGKVEVEAMRMSRGVGYVRECKGRQRLLLATLGEGRHLYQKALWCYRRGHESGDATRLRWSGQILQHACREGETRALVALARLHLEGAGVAESVESALALLQRAAERGSAKGAWALGRAFWERRGELAHAYMWFRVAEALGVADDAAAVLSSLGEHISPALAARAEVNAAKWLKRNNVVVAANGAPSASAASVDGGSGSAGSTGVASARSGRPDGRKVAGDAPPVRTPLTTTAPAAVPAAAPAAAPAATPGAAALTRGLLPRDAALATPPSPFAPRASMPKALGAVAPAPADAAAPTGSLHDVAVSSGAAAAFAGAAARAGAGATLTGVKSAALDADEYEYEYYTDDEEEVEELDAPAEAGRGGGAAEGALTLPDYSGNLGQYAGACQAASAALGEATSGGGTARSGRSYSYYSDEEDGPNQRVLEAEAALSGSGSSSELDGDLDDIESIASSQLYDYYDD